MNDTPSPLLKKLGLQPGFNIHFLNPPLHYTALLANLSSGTVTDAPGPYDLIHAFTRSQIDLFASLPHLKRQLKPGGVLWLSWPKSGATINTNLTEGMVRGAGLDTGLTPSDVIEVDHDWLGLKFENPLEG